MNDKEPIKLEYQKKIQSLLEDIDYLKKSCIGYPATEIKDLKLKIIHINRLIKNHSH